MRKAFLTLLLALMAASVMTVVPALASMNERSGSAGSTRSYPATSARSYPATAARSGDDLDVIGLTTDGRLVRFDSTRPGRTRSLGLVSGLSGDTSLVGIDYRVQDGMLYGVGNAGGIYTVSDRNAAATKVSQLTVALNGTQFGVDFNPAANRLRVISDTGQNLRHNIDDPAGAPPAGTTATDGTLTIPPATAAAAGVTGAAYTNNDLDPNTATTLFDLDTNLDQVAVQSPANAGSLAPTGKLRVDTGSAAGFDIYSTVRGGTTVGARAFATLQVGGRSAFFTVSLLTGNASPVDFFRARDQVTDIAIPLNQR